MSLETGSRIGPYEITGQLGAGGMGEVYRAKDLNLGREVAIKVLPEGLADEPERLARFEREAQLLASLNHPNIGGIYGLEEAQGNRCLILELVEGKTLAELIDQGPIPVETAVRLALQIAMALEVAHEKGIVHRDLKPANVMVTGGTGGDRSADLSPQVKVLDFGLAKAFTDDVAEGTPDLSHSPTLTIAATKAGVILGTAAYMSPEQAAGQPADRRSDIWSFGVVLLEMLSGHRSFAGETVSHTLAAVLKDDPEWDRLPDDLPPRLLELLKSCLRKKSRNRLQAIGDARIVLEAWLADPASFDVPSTVASAPAVAPKRQRLPWIVTGVLAVALVATLALLWPSESGPRTAIRVNLDLPDGQLLFRGYGSSVALSPDGSKLAYSILGQGQDRSLFLRGLDQWDAIELAQDKAPYNPFFSPDGAWIGFVDREAMYKVPVRGGSPIKLTDVSLNRGSSWGEDGYIVYAKSPNSGLSRILESGGEPESLTEVEEAGSHRWPQVLPGAKAVLFTSQSGSDDSWDAARIEILDLATREHRVIHEGGTYARYLASGQLVFASGTSLFAAPFDLDALEISGPIVPVLENVSTDMGRGGAQFDVSSNGVLIYAPVGGEDPGDLLVRVSRDGSRVAVADDHRKFSNPELSPDEKHLAVQITVEGKSDIWVYDLDRRLATRITSGVGSHTNPIWSPDGKWIYYGVSDSGVKRIERIAADGSGRPESLLEGERDARPLSVSPDGTQLIFRYQATAKIDLFRLQIDNGESEPFIETAGLDYDARFSPDGRWVAYGSDESGSFEVYIVPASNGRGRWQVSDGGIYPRWSSDGRAVFYRDVNDGRLFEVSVETGSGTIRAGRPRPIIDPGPYRFINGDANDFAVAGKGQTFIMLEKQQSDTETHEHLNVVLNWDDALRSIAGGR